MSTFNSKGPFKNAVTGVEGEGYPKLATNSDIEGGGGVHANSDITTKKI